MTVAPGSLHDDPPRRRDDARARQPARGHGRAQPGERPRAGRPLYLLPRWSRTATSRGSAWPRSSCATAYPSGSSDAVWSSPPTRVGARGQQRRRRGPAHHWVPSLGRHLMTYVAFGPLGPRLALAVSEDLEHWRRLGPVQFGYQPGLDTDLCMFPNKDAVFFPEPVPIARQAVVRHVAPADVGPRLVPRGRDRAPPRRRHGRTARDLDLVRPAELAEADIRALARPRNHRCVALSEYPYEELKIGAGPPPVRVDEGWLLIHHGVSGESPRLRPDHAEGEYAAGAMLLDADDPSGCWREPPSPSSGRRPTTSSTAPCPTSCSRPRSRRSTGSATSSTAWPTPRSASRGSTVQRDGAAGRRRGRRRRFARFLAGAVADLPDDTSGGGRGQRPDAGSRPRDRARRPCRDLAGRICSPTPRSPSWRS